MGRGWTIRKIRGAKVKMKKSGSGWDFKIVDVPKNSGIWLSEGWQPAKSLKQAEKGISEGMQGDKS